MTLTDTERKLVVLMLDRSAEAGEIANATVALAKALRKRYADGYALLAELEGSSQEQISRYAETVLTFGKHRGRKLCEIPLSYLQWALDNVALDRYLRRAVERYLDTNRN
jgi:Putative quorum-sensing-regulated virulence factor